MRSRRAQFIYDRHYNRIGLQPRVHTRSGRPVKKLRRLLHKNEKRKGICMEGYLENIICYYSSAFTINPQPRRRSVRSHKREQ